MTKETYRKMKREVRKLKKTKAPDPFIEYDLRFDYKDYYARHIKALEDKGWSVRVEDLTYDEDDEEEYSIVFTKDDTCVHFYLYPKRDENKATVTLEGSLSFNDLLTLDSFMLNPINNEENFMNFYEASRKGERK